MLEHRADLIWALAAYIWAAYIHLVMSEKVGGTLKYKCEAGGIR